MNRIWKMSLLITTVILLDQFTKGIIQSRFALGESINIIDGFFNITYVRNSGAAWGIGASSSGLIRVIFILALPVFACFFLVYLIWTSRRENILVCTAYSLILAGAIGNLIDRFSLSYVVDFFDFYFGTSHFPAFNVADSSITVAACFLVLMSFKSSKKP